MPMTTAYPIVRNFYDPSGPGRNGIKTVSSFPCCEGSPYEALGRRPLLSVQPHHLDRTASFAALSPVVLLNIKDLCQTPLHRGSIKARCASFARAKVLSSRDCALRPCTAVLDLQPNLRCRERDRKRSCRSMGRKLA